MIGACALEGPPPGGDAGYREAGLYPAGPSGDHQAWCGPLGPASAHVGYRNGVLVPVSGAGCPGGRLVTCAAPS